MNYVDAGYTVALVTLAVYAAGLGLRRRRWERARGTIEQGEATPASTADAPAAPAPGGRP